MGEPELYLIKLFRKTVHDPEDVRTRDDYGNEEPGRKDQSFLSMDYFDVLSPQKICIDKGIGVFMDIYASSDKKLTKYDISMQSIPVYCSKEDIIEHEKKVLILSEDGMTEEEAAIYGNPFKRDKRHPYLSLIQVYIMPEAMARIELLDVDSKPGIRNKVTRGIVDQFYGDIHAIIDTYARDYYHKDRFVCRVYRSMSAGDFTVAISGDSPETAFLIATLLRERGCFYESDTEQKQRYIFYKTFTLLSCNEQWIHCGLESQTDENVSSCPPQLTDDREAAEGEKKSFVIRATFSSKYWSENAKDNLTHGFTRLNGRYDFSEELSESAFKYMSRILYDYKIGGEKANIWKAPDRKEEERLRKYLGKDYGKCMKLCGYISQGYLAYINERYIFGSKEIEILPKSKPCPTAIRLREETRDQDFISRTNEEIIGKVEMRLENLYKKIMSLDTNRWNLFYHLNLLKWMLNLCRSINGLSDTRIYAAILTHQISIVLKGMEDACLMVEREKNRNLIPIMEHAFVEAVYSLNTYAQMIRDNNLQSLQTPNYNLESSVSIEKILVGYGELLKSLFEWYEATDVCNEIYGLRQRYIPFMIPGNHDESLRTKVLFKEIKSNIADEKLMVVWSSAFSDLTNFSGTLGILFHEVAHNLRYKGRTERNSIIMKYCVYLICDQIAISIVKNLEQNIPELMDSVSLTRLICDSLYKSYWQVVYADRGIPAQVKDYSYVGINDFIYNEHSNFTEVVRQINEVDKFIRRSISLRSEGKNELREKALIDLMELRRSLIYGLDSASGRKDYLGQEVLDKDPVLQLTDKTIDSLNNYIKDKTEKGTYKGDISAKVIFDLLLANNTHRDEFEKMLPRYRLVDRFFNVFSEQLEAQIADREKSGKPEYSELTREIGRIRRYFTRSGGQFTSTSLLASYVSPHIVRTCEEASDIMKQATAMYSEVASDLFMYNLVEMTPFGYLSFLSEYIPSEARVSHTYIRRFSIVMYAAFGAPAMRLSRDDKKRYWQGFVEKLFNDFVLSADKSLELLLDKLLEQRRVFDPSDYIVETENNDKKVIRKPLSYWMKYVQAHIVARRNKYFQTTTDNMVYFDGKCEDMEAGDSDELFAGWGQFGEETYRELTEEETRCFDQDTNPDEEATLEPTLGKCVFYFKFLCGYINAVYERVTDEALDEDDGEQKREAVRKLEELKNLKRELKRWGFMSSFLHRLYQEIIQEIVTVEALDFLADDYRAGFCNTRRLHDEFVREEMAGNKAGCWMWPYFREVKEVLNHPVLRYSDDETRKSNMSMLEMITELYYRAIWECASGRTLERD